VRSREDEVDETLRDSWERTRGHLARAWVELPLGGSDDLIWYQEFLDQNELGLAMEALQGVGEDRNAPRTFWAALVEAASEMKLADLAELYRSRALPSEPINGSPPGT
jgi:hypothetical protein